LRVYAHVLRPPAGGVVRLAGVDGRLLRVWRLAAGVPARVAKDSVPAAEWGGMTNGLGRPEILRFEFSEPIRFRRQAGPSARPFATEFSSPKKDRNLRRKKG